jgi:hypothetical protein
MLMTLAQCQQPNTLPPHSYKPGPTTLSNARLWIAFGLAGFAIYSGFILDRDTILYSVLALAASFLAFGSFHHLTTDDHQISSHSRLNYIIQCLWWRVLVCLVATVIFQVLVFGLPDISVLSLAQNTVLKIALWASLFHIVGYKIINHNTDPKLTPLD